MKLFFSLLLIIILPFAVDAQQYITKSIKDFGAKGNGRSNDQDAFVKATIFFNSRKGNGKLIIPKGIYLVGRQKFTGTEKNSNSPYKAEMALELRNCNNLTIEGKPGAVLKNNDSLHIGTFSPETGKSFKHNMRDINTKTEYINYAAGAGMIIYTSGCSNIKISGLSIDGNIGNFIFGGNWGTGRNAFELIHYGIYILDSKNVSITNCSIKNFACDGIYIANLGKEVKTFNINIDKCKVNYCGRNGLSWLGGENIRVTNSVFSNQGKGVVHESPAAGIDIEVENSSFCRKGYFYNCTMENNVGSAITSGSKNLTVGVLFRKCSFASPGYYTVFIDALSHIFEDCKIYGTALIWYDAKTIEEATKFKNCVFDENYKGKKMYDASYQLGVEANATQIDNCTFKAYTTANYYLKGHTSDCGKDNVQKISVSNCVFYNYGIKDFKLAQNTAGIAGHTVFYNNKFYSKENIVFQNGFKGNCNADAGNNKFFPAP